MEDLTFLVRGIFKTNYQDKKELLEVLRTYFNDTKLETEKFTIGGLINYEETIVKYSMGFVDKEERKDLHSFVIE